MSRRVQCGLINYYGKVELVGGGGKWHLELNDFCGPESVEVSEEFASAFIKEFGEAECSECGYSASPIGPCDMCGGDWG